MIENDDKLYLYHYNKCSKSRQVKKILDDKNVAYVIVDYINVPIDIKLLDKTLKNLKYPIEILRTNEKIFREINKTQTRSKENYLDLILNYPILLQRPIISIERRNKIIKSLICRPPEIIQQIFV